MEMINYHGKRVRSTVVVRVSDPDAPETVTVTDTTTVIDTTTVTTGETTDTNSTGGGSDDSGLGLSAIQTAFVTSFAFITLIISRRKVRKL